MAYIIIAIAVFLSAGVACVLLLRRLSTRIQDLIDLLIYCLLGFSAAIHIIPGLAWCVALIPPLNDPANPYITGIGGAAYGMNYRYYPYAALFYSLLSIASAASGFIILRRGGTVRFVVESIRENFRRLPLRHILVGSFVLACGYLILSGALLGWRNLWSVDTTRRDLADAVLFGFIDHRSFVLAAFFVSLPLVIIGCFGDLRTSLGCALIVALFALPSVALGSRRGSALLLAVVFFLTIRTRYRMWLLIPSAILSIFIYLHPLVLRAQNSGLGLRNAAVVAKEMVGFDFEHKNYVILALCNLGQGFPLFVESLDAKFAGVNILQGVPRMYYAVSFSPFPSLIDGYKQNYLQYHARVNQYSPYNGYAEMAALNIFWGWIFIFVFIFVSVKMLLLIKAIPGWGRWSAVLLFMGTIVMLAHMQQYNVRQASRFFFYPFDVTLLLIVVHRIFGPRVLPAKVNRVSPSGSGMPQH